MQNNSLKIKPLFLWIVLFTAGTNCLSQSVNYVIDNQTAVVKFSVKHLGVLTVEGQFVEFAGMVLIKDNKLEHIHCKIQTSSINTKDKNRDKTIKGEAYFDVLAYPLISFVSTQIIADKEQSSITGNLTIKGVTKEIYMPFRLNNSLEKNHRIVLIETQISREYFDLDFGSMNSLIGDIVKIEIQINLEPK